MQAQIRIYTINKGELDTFIKHFKEETKPLHDKVGWPVVASWVNRPQNEFIGSGPTRTPPTWRRRRRPSGRRSRPRVSRSAPTSRRWKSAKSRWPGRGFERLPYDTDLLSRELPPGRRTLRRNRVTFQSEAEAMASGYRACKVCKPDQGSGPWQPKAVKTVLLQEPAVI